jgi:exopolysaccharide biosynthesis polyprenyl glycosylphosphotransferase
VSNLKRRLVTGDFFSLLVGYGIVFVMGGAGIGRVGRLKLCSMAVAAAAGALLTIASKGLTTARISEPRVIELTRSFRAMALVTAAMLLVAQWLRVPLGVSSIIVGGAVSWLLFCAHRSAFRSWLRHARAADRHCRRVIVVGADECGMRIVRLFNHHPELGTRVVGIVSDEPIDGVVPWLGPVDESQRLAVELEVSGVIVSPTAASGARLDTLVRALQSDGIHIHLVPSLPGVDARRLRSIPLSYEPLLYVDPPGRSSWPARVKRAFDVIAAGLGLAVTAPLLIVVAVAVKVTDGGPILFRQVRVGRNGAQFEVLKFRTMVIDAEHRLSQLSDVNERTGPLFKMQADPRVTRIGKLLRETGIDELPQLINVVRGEMSLVGPRPALPSEVERFPQELRAREQALPGITGLWQVEARDNPSFDAYQRLDLFYIQNWCLTLDVVILLATVEQTAARIVRMVWYAVRSPTPTAVADRVHAGTRANALQTLSDSEKLAS